MDIDKIPKASAPGEPEPDRDAAKMLALVYLDSDRGNEALALLREFEGFEIPQDGTIDKDNLLDQLVWVRAKIAAGESVDTGTWPSELTAYLRNEVVDTIGICGQLFHVRGAVEALAGLGRVEEAKALQQEIISTARKSLQGPDAKWADSTEQCMTALASIRIP